MGDLAEGRFEGTIYYTSVSTINPSDITLLIGRLYILTSPEIRVQENVCILYPPSFFPFNHLFLLRSLFSSLSFRFLAWNDEKDAEPFFL